MNEVFDDHKQNHNFSENFGEMAGADSSNIVNIKIEHEFSSEEKAKLTSDLARKIMEKNKLVEEKKETVLTFNNKIKSIEREIDYLARALWAGKEWRYEECEIRLNYETKMREYISTATREVVRTEPFRDEDYQGDLFYSCASTGPEPLSDDERSD